MKQCPYCAEDIRAAAIKCRYCLSDLPATTLPAQPASAADANQEAAVADALPATDPRSWDLDYFGGEDVRLDLVSVEFLDHQLVLHGTATNEASSDRPHSLLLQLIGYPEGEDDYFVQNRETILGTIPRGTTIRWSLPVHESNTQRWLQYVQTLSGFAGECEVSVDGTPVLGDSDPLATDPREVVALIETEWTRGGDAPGVRVLGEDATPDPLASALTPNEWTIALAGMPGAAPHVLGIEYFNSGESRKVIVSGTLETTTRAPAAVGISASLYRSPDYANAVAARAATIQGIQPGKTTRWCAFIDVPAAEEFLRSIDRLVVMIDGVEETEVLARHMAWDFFPGQMTNAWTSGRAREAPGLLNNPTVVVVDHGEPDTRLTVDFAADVTWVGVTDWKGIRRQTATSPVPMQCGACHHEWSVPAAVANDLAVQQGLGQKLIRGGTRLERFGATFSPGSSGRRIAAGLESQRHEEALAHAYARVACPTCGNVAELRLGQA